MPRCRGSATEHTTATAPAVRVRSRTGVDVEPAVADVPVHGPERLVDRRHDMADVRVAVPKTGSALAELRHTEEVRERGCCGSEVLHRAAHRINDRLVARVAGQGVTGQVACRKVLLDNAEEMVLEIVADPADLHTAQGVADLDHVGDDEPFDRAQGRGRNRGEQRRLLGLGLRHGTRSFSSCGYSGERHIGRC